jgi:stage II sporulation protein M
MNFLKEQYTLCYKFLTESRWHIVFTLSVFALTFLIGFTFPIFFREKIFEFMAEMLLTFEGLTATQTIGFIFFNNLQASFFSIVLGVFFAIFPLITSVVNGYLIGFVTREAANTEGILIMWRLLPHGIFEIPAIIFSMGLGMKLGTDLIFKKDRKKNFVKNFRESMRVFLFIILPLLIIAAIIEGILVFALA